ncbi:MAG TPA: polysaccharide biosynthesis protein [Vicinamibacterales bacterium]|nr:polysaccharide biosynthesis protein [Vicinamibacterales bacterium]
MTLSTAAIERLLGRPVSASLTADDRKKLAGQSILVTGAGGSIGSELARELAACGPSRLTLVDRSELNLFNIEREIAEKSPAVPLQASLVDVCRARDIWRVMRQARPAVVYHAAAYKHVTMTERAPAPAAEVNVIGTIETVEAASACGARFVLISSDKAAAPHSVMGATKRAAELSTLLRASSVFRPIVVRFGNVLASSGSVVQLMRERIHAGRPIQLTDTEATRYFMSVGEAAALVIKADLLAKSPATFWLDMGRPIRMADLVTRVLDVEVEAGFPRVPVEIIGLRPGEKRDEVLFDSTVTLGRTEDERIMVAATTPGDRVRVRRAERLLRRAIDHADAPDVLDLLAGLTGFSPSAQARRAAGAWSAAGGWEPEGIDFSTRAADATRGRVA